MPGYGKTKTPSREERVTWDDWVMLVLAVLSLAILIAESAFEWALDPGQKRALILADLAIVGVFIIEFLGRLIRAPRKWRFIVSNWYDIIGMIPVSHPMLRSFRLLRLLRILVITSRFVRATNRTFGEMTVEAIAGRYRDILVEAIGDRLILQSLDMLEGPLGRSRLPATVGATLSHRREDLRALVQRSLQGIPVVRRMVRLPWSNEILLAMENVSLEVIVGVLESEEVNRTIQQSILSGLHELRRSVREKEEMAMSQTSLPS